MVVLVFPDEPGPWALLCPAGPATVKGKFTVTNTHAEFNFGEIVAKHQAASSQAEPALGIPAAYSAREASGVQRSRISPQAWPWAL